MDHEKTLPLKRQKRLMLAEHVPVAMVTPQIAAYAPGVRLLLACLIVGASACEDKRAASPASAAASAVAPSAASASPSAPASLASSAEAPPQSLPAWVVPPPELAEALNVEAPICSRSESLHFGSEPSRTYVVDVPAATLAKLEQHFRGFAKSAGLAVIEEPIVGMRVEAKSGKVGATLKQWKLFVTVLGEPSDRAATIDALLAEGPPELRKVVDAAGRLAIGELDVTRFSNGQREITIKLASRKSVADLAKAAALRDYGDGLFASEKKAVAPADWHVMVSKDGRSISVTASQKLAASSACKLADEWNGRPDANASANPSADKKTDDELMKEMLGE